MLLFFLLYTASTLVIILSSVWALLYIIGRCLVFRKAERSFWKALIPIWGECTEYGISWLSIIGAINSFLYILYSVIYKIAENSSITGVPSTGAIVTVSVIAAASSAITIIQKYKLARAFGHGVIFTLGLIFLSPIFYLVLGFDQTEYLGNPSLGELY